MAWAGPPAHPHPAGAEVVNLLDIVAGAAEGGAVVTGTYARDLSLYRSSPLASKAAAAGSRPPAWEPAAAATPRGAFTLMLTTVHNFLKAVNEMTAVYDSEEVVHSHKNIWLAMRQAQLPPP